MSQAAINFDLPMRWGLRPTAKTSMRRQIAMAVLFLLLCGVIVAYWIVTDSERVRSMAETYLSDILGGKVKVRRAHLSVFEGLRLEDVAVYVDDRMEPDSEIFRARTFLVRTNPAALLDGRVEATQIVALDPHVRLCESVDETDWRRRWNYQRMSRRRKDPTLPSSGKKGIVLPQIVLRAGVIEYARVRNGIYEHARTLMAIDGHLRPTDSLFQYRFNLVSRSPGEAIGPRLVGSLNLNPERIAVTASLQNLEFNRTIRAMLPSAVQEWWEAHQLSGRIRIPHLAWAAGKPGEDDEFLIVIEPENVSLAALPHELMGWKEYQRQRLARPGLPVGDSPNFGLVSQLLNEDEILAPLPIAVRNVSGRFVFTPRGIRFSGVTGSVEGNRVTLNGMVERDPAASGYTRAGKVEIHVSAGNLVLPENPRWLPSLPRGVRRVYAILKPRGRANLSMYVGRDAPEQKLVVTGRINVTDGAFQFDEFPYPIRNVVGAVAFGPDPITGENRVDLIDVRGRGIPATANENATVTVNGWLCPIERYSGIDVRIEARNVLMDTFVRQSFPRDVAKTVAMFDVRELDGEKVVAPASVRGNFNAQVLRAKGPKKRIAVNVDIDLAQGEGSFEHFRYPLRNLTGKVQVRPNHVLIKDVVSHHNGMTMTIDGRVDHGGGRPVAPLLNITARNTPVDADLHNALDPRQRQWLKKIGLNGKLDINAAVFPAKPRDPADDTIGFNIRANLTDGALWPIDNTHALQSMTGQITIDPDKIVLENIKAIRGNAPVAGGGTIAWPAGSVAFDLAADATDLAFDKTLRALIPRRAQQAWDQLRPDGKLDLSIRWAGQTPDDSEKAVEQGIGQEHYDVSIRPKGASLLPIAFPWRMDGVSGEISVNPERILLTDLVGRHGDATLRLTGRGKELDNPGWTLSLSGQNINVDDTLLKALPRGIASTIEAVKLKGALSFNAPNLTYSTVDPPPPATAAAASPAPSATPAPSTLATRPATQPVAGISEIAFNARVDLANGALDLGVPLASVNGSIELPSVVIRGGDLYSLDGKIDIPTLIFAGRDMTGLRAEVSKPPGTVFYLFRNLQARMSGGILAGRVGLGVPKIGSSRYALSLVLREADVRQLAGETAEKIRGRMSASLDLEGNWDNVSSRRGGGSVRVQGRELRRVPVLLGLMQITNLAMPIGEPFNEATARYVVDGQRVTFESVELHAENMMMKGTGQLDFASKQVKMSFITDNPNWRIPGPLGELFEGAKRELMQIHITGTIQEPQVSAKSMNVFSTTIDQVMKGRPDGREKK